MDIKGVVLAKNLPPKDIPMHIAKYGFYTFSITQECTTDLLRDLMYEYGFKRKELVLLTTSKEEAMTAHHAFCRYWVLDNAEECTVGKVHEILQSKKFGI
jgi:hypothetical protein